MMSENLEMCGKKWTIEEEEKLLKYIREGIKYENIAKEHKRTIGGIISKFKGIVKIRIDNGDTIKKISKDINISEHILNDILIDILKEKVENKYNFFVYNELKCLKSKTILIFDLETTGIPNTEKEKIPAYKLYKSFEETNIYNNINIVQIGWCYIEGFNIDNIDEYEIKSEIRKPLNFTIPEESIKFHGIDDEKAKKEGLKLSKILNDNDFYGMIEKCDYIIAHNAEYDYNVLMSEIKKLGYDDLYKLLLESKNKIICTYKGTHGKYSLKRLYNDTFGCDFNNAHTADGDVKALLEIISGRKLKKEKKIEKNNIELQIKYEKNRKK
jgi:DNA polymerase III epsilon subunit-like protein